MHVQDGPKPEIMIIGDKLITLIEYWEHNFYKNKNNVMPKCCAEFIESLMVSLSR